MYKRIINVILLKEERAYVKPYIYIDNNLRTFESLIYLNLIMYILYSGFDLIYIKDR